MVYEILSNAIKAVLGCKNACELGGDVSRTVVSAIPTDDLLLAMQAAHRIVVVYQSDRRIVGGGSPAGVVDVVQVARRVLSQPETKFGGWHIR